MMLAIKYSFSSCCVWVVIICKSQISARFNRE